MLFYPHQSERIKYVESKSNDRSDLEGLVLAVYDVIECVQQLLWLIVTADPKNTFGKKAKFDSTPFELLVRSLKLSLKTMTKSWISATVLVSEFGRYQSSSLRLADLCVQFSLQVQNNVLSKFMTDTAASLRSKIDEFKATLEVWNGAEWARGDFLQVAISGNNLIKSIEDILRSPEFKFEYPVIHEHTSYDLELMIDPVRQMIYSLIDLLDSDSSNSHSSFMESTSKVLEMVLEKAPGQRRCHNAIDCVTLCKEKTKNALAKIQEKQPLVTGTVSGCLRDHLNSVATDFPELDLLCGYLAEAAVNNPTMMGHRAEQISNRVENMTTNLICACCKTRKQSKQTKLLGHMQLFNERMESFLSACKIAGGNVKNINAHEQVKLSFNEFKKAKDELSLAIEDNPDQELFGLNHLIERALSKVNNIIHMVVDHWSIST